MYKLICSFGQVKIFFGQVHYGHLLVPGQVENFIISTSLLEETQMTMLQNGQLIRVLTVCSQIAKKKKNANGLFQEILCCDIEHQTFRFLFFTGLRMKIYLSGICAFIVEFLVHMHVIFN